MGVITMKNAEGVAVNVDPETVEAIQELTGKACALRIGAATVVVRGTGKDVAGRIERERGRPVDVLAGRRRERKADAGGAPAGDGTGEGGQEGGENGAGE